MNITVKNLDDNKLLSGAIHKTTEFFPYIRSSSSRERMPVLMSTWISLTVRIKHTYDINMTAKQMLKLLQNDGWFVYEQNGSHIQFKHPVKKGRVTVPNHKGDLKKGTEYSILKQAGLK